jgi:hypothetical protein
VEEITYENSEGTKFLWWPSRPRPELGPSGQPTLMLIAGSERAILQLGLRWYATDDDLASAQRVLDEKIGEPVTLAPATLDSVEALLDLDGQELARSTTSGAPPYTSLFNIRLEGAQLAAVRRALAGAADVLRARYRALVVRTRKLSAEISGDASEDVAALIRDPRGNAAARVDAALAAGRLRFLGDARPDLRDRAKDGCAEMLRRLAAGAVLETSASDLRVQIVDEERTSTPLEVTADVGAWFARSAARPNILELPAGTNP